MLADNAHKQELESNEHICGMPVECWSRVTGYFRPVSAWNKGKKEEFHDRVMFNIRPANCCERKKNG